MAISGGKEIKFRWYVRNCSEIGEGRVILDKWSEKTPNDGKEWAR